MPAVVILTAPMPSASAHEVFVLPLSAISFMVAKVLKRFVFHGTSTKKNEFDVKHLVEAWIIVIFAVVMKHAKLLTLVLALLMALPMHAVLKEEDLSKTLYILRKELTKTYLEMEENMKSSKEMNKRILTNLFSIMQRSNQNALMLYSQKPNYVFDLTYACHEATDQYQDFRTKAIPLRTLSENLRAEIERYDSLIVSLQQMATHHARRQRQS